MNRFVAAVLVVASFAACDGGDPLTQKEFVSRANDICRDATEERAETLADVVPSPSPGLGFGGALNEAVAGFIKGFAAYARSSHEVMGDVLDGLGDLEPPDEDEDAVEAMLESLEEVRDYYGDYAEAYEERNEGDLDDLQEDEEAREAHSEFVERAEDLKLTECEELVDPKA